MLCQKCWNLPYWRHFDVKTESFVDPATTGGRKRKLGSVVASRVGDNLDAFNSAFDGDNSDLGLFTSFWDTVSELNKDWAEEHAANLKRNSKGVYVAGPGFAIFLDEQLQLTDPEDIANDANQDKLRELVRHPIYVLLGYVISRHGFGFDLTRFSDSAKFKRMITPRFLARILFTCIKSGNYIIIPASYLIKLLTDKSNIANYLGIYGESFGERNSTVTYENYFASGEVGLSQLTR
jgi:hypothetical protein